MDNLRINANHNGCPVVAIKDLHWVAQKVKAGTKGTIYWKWLWYKDDYKHWDTYTKKKRMGKTVWGHWYPTITWKRKRNKYGCHCVLQNFKGIRSTQNSLFTFAATLTERHNIEICVKAFNRETAIQSIKDRDFDWDTQIKHTECVTSKIHIDSLLDQEHL